jgi:cullin 1
MEAVWQKLLTGLQNVYSIDLEATNQKSIITKQEYIQLYTMIYNNCNATQPIKYEDPAKFFYDRLSLFITSYITSLSAETQIQTTDTGLQKFNKIWANYNLSSVITSNLFNYINRIWVKSMSEKSGGVLEIHRLTQVAWLTYILDTRIGQLDQIINTLINTERDGNIINTRLITNFVRQLLAIGCETDTYGDHKGSRCAYRKYFETNFMANTRDYYRRRANELIQQTDITGYMLVIADWITTETGRASLYLHNISHQQVGNILEDTLIRDFAEQMVAELPRYFNSGMNDEISILYLLMKRISNVQLMADMFGSFINTNGLAAIMGLQDDDPNKFMSAVLGIYSDGQRFLCDHFKSDILFISAFDKAHKAFINTNAITTASKRPGAIANILSKYSDAVMRGSTNLTTSKTSSSNTQTGNSREDDMDIHLENIINIFKYLEDKDIYQKFYSKYLAKRLISGKIISEDAENSMISKLKGIYGQEFTSRFQTMTKDLTASRELSAKYKSSLVGKSSATTGFDILVLTSGSWPIQAATGLGKLVLPAELQKFSDSFTAFYHANSQGRKLTWLHNLSYGELQTNYIKSSDGKRAKYVFQTSGIQMVILLAFNQQETMTRTSEASPLFTFTDLAHATGLKSDYLALQIELLVKMKILKVKPDADNPAYSLNTKYSYKKIKVNINQPIKSEVAAETNDLVKGAEEDRTFAIQATIVRIMKSRNVLSHALLVGETIQQCSKYFTPKVQSIKKNIDSLIEKEYLKRCEGKRDEYIYVA